MGEAGGLEGVSSSSVVVVSAWWGEREERRGKRVRKGVERKDED